MTLKPFRAANSYMASLIRLIYPRICSACSADLYPGEDFICLHCRQAMIPTDHIDRPENTVFDMLRPFIPLKHAASAYYFGRGLIIQQLMHEIKYGRNRELAVHLGTLVGSFLRRDPAWTSIDHLVPIPLHARRRMQRGFNQSEQICRGISSVMGIPVCTTLLERSRKTATQTHMSRSERWENLSGAFQLKDPTAATGKHILLVDDVITTGATILAAAIALLEIPDVTISVASAACAGEL